MDAALARPDLEAYRGWLRFLRFEAQAEAKKSGAASEAAGATARRLDEWLGRILGNPGVLRTLSGVQEWAYESPVDDSGQPFKMAIPTDYDPSRPSGLNVYMHGSGGNHLEHATAMAAHEGSFEISVLGRARDGGYRALSEADVLQAVAYVEAHWAIDPNRISLRGGSMGGGGTYRLGSRFPQLWSSGRPTCGFASGIPMGNLITLPLYAIHSDDDPVVSILHERGPLAQLRGLGAQVIFDETNGYGHAVWDYKEGGQRAAAWAKDKVRIDSRKVRHIDYTATDGGAVRGWWGQIAEWGPAPREARFVLAAGEGDGLYATLENIARLKVFLSESPLERDKPLRVSVNGRIPIVVPAPLPDCIFLVATEKGWDVAPDFPPPPVRLHTPGSASLLYDGEPLLIVYGTGGTAAEREALLAAATSASQSPNPSWPDEGGSAGDEGVPDSHNLYGSLRIKADSEVTAADLARCHLVLLGTPSQNSIVRRMAPSLPVSFEPGGISCSDGERFRGDSLALGLVYYDPLAPGRLVFWVASEDPAAYRAKSAIPFVMSGGRSFSASAFPGDLLVMTAGSPTLVASRSFDSRWNWVGGRGASALLGSRYGTAEGLSVGVAAALGRATGADFAMVGLYGSPPSAPVDVGSTRVSDLSPEFANDGVGVFEVSGEELLAMQKKALAAGSGILMPGLDATRVEGSRRYSVALPTSLLWAFSGTVRTAPADYRLAGLDMRDVVEKFLPPQ